MASFVITRKLLFISRVDKCLNILNVRYESKNKYFKRIEYSYYNVRDIKVKKHFLQMSVAYNFILNY